MFKHLSPNKMIDSYLISTLLKLRIHNLTGQRGTYLPTCFHAFLVRNDLWPSLKCCENARSWIREGNVAFWVQPNSKILSQHTFGSFRWFGLLLKTSSLMKRFAQIVVFPFYSASDMKYKKRLLLWCIHHFKSDLIKHFGHINIWVT